jgi:hypothetical protein
LSLNPERNTLARSFLDRWKLSCPSAYPNSQLVEKIFQNVSLRNWKALL